MLKNFLKPTERLKNCNGTEYFADEEFEVLNDGFDATMATKPVHEFTRAKIPTINTYCGLNISTETEPGSLGTTSSWTRTTPFPMTTWPPTTKLPPTTSLSLEKAMSGVYAQMPTTKNIETQMFSLGDPISQKNSTSDPNPEPDSGPNPENLTLNHSEELNGLEALIM